MGGNDVRKNCKIEFKTRKQNSAILKALSKQYYKETFHKPYTETILRNETTISMNMFNIFNLMFVHFCLRECS